MPAAWRLAIRNLSQRRSRTGLLVCSVALCAALIAAIACAMASVTAAVQKRVDDAVGLADVRLSHVGGAAFSTDVLERVRAFPDVELAAGRFRGSPALKNPRTGQEARTIGVGIDANAEPRLRPVELLTGRWVATDREVVLEQALAERLAAEVGDKLVVQRFGEPLELSVVGVARQPSLSVIFDQLQAYMTLATLGEAEDRRNRLTEIDILLRPGSDAEAWLAARATDVPRESGLRMQVSARISSGLQSNVRSNQIGFILASVLAFIAAGFIITTGLTTAVTEKTRELSILRAVGGTRGQLAASQLAVGLIVGGIGGLIGVPLGIAGSAVLVAFFPEQLPAGFAFSWLGVVLGLSGSLLAGLVGGVWPAVAAARVTPLEGLSVRARPVKKFWFFFCIIGGLAALAAHASIILLGSSPDLTFWTYVFLGVPCMMAGYFLLSVPITRMAARALAPALTGVLRLPGNLLDRTIAATPYRHGFTAGAMMLGLAMMVSIWTNGRSVMLDWLNELKIPDAFAYFVRGTDEATLRKVASVPGVAHAAAISDLTVELEAKQAQGISGLQKFRTSFIAFEPEPFFAMTSLDWIVPSDDAGIAAAKARLAGGNAVLVAREFHLARGVNPGDTLPVTFNGVTHTFTVAGVVASPGLEIVSKFYSVGQDAPDQAVSAIFGTREDLRRVFNNDSVRLIQIGLEDRINKAADPVAESEKVLNAIRGIVGLGAYEIGSAVEIKRRISQVISGALLIASVVAVGAMLISCFAVANLIVAGVQTRQFEFGVLRAVGAQREVLGRLVIGEAVVIAAAACVLGTLMGTQAAWGGQLINRLVIGLQLSVRPPLGPIAVGCAAVLIITIAAAWPAAHRLVRRQPRELLLAMKG
jgi:putative ABC transport system permease protein